MTPQTNGQVDLLWIGEQMAGIVSDLYRRIGYSEVGSSKPQFPIYDLGHPNRGFTDFPDVMTLSGLEDCEFDNSNREMLGLKARISAPALLGQLHRVISEYLAGDKRRHPEWYEKKLDILGNAVTASEGISVRLEMRARAAERPQYRLEEYGLL